VAWERECGDEAVIEGAGAAVKEKHGDISPSKRPKNGKIKFK
jgi:hypothetical protein